MATEKSTRLDMNFLDMQAHVGVTKHMGGFEATNELLSLCHIEDAREVLNVGCGIGVGPVYIAKKYDCRVVGVDISDKMIEWSRRRAREEHVEAKVELRMADVLELPFEADRFDIVIVESVLIFVEDKPRAIRECVRVTKPGGVVKICQVDPRKEIKDRMQWIGWRWLLRAWGRALRLYITNPGVRQSIKEMFDVPPEAFQCIGYGLFVGKK